MAVISADELAAVLERTGRRHHQAFIESDGADAEWASWYAASLQTEVWDGFGRLPTRSELVHLLIAAERRHGADAPDEPWPAYYADYILENVT